MQPPHAIISRKEARALGRKRYFTGKPCIRGHVDERIVTDGRCLACARETDRAKRASDPTGYYEKKRQYRASHPHVYVAAHVRYRLKYPDRCKAARRRRYLALNGKEQARLARLRDPERFKEAKRRRFLRNPEKVRLEGRLAQARRRARKVTAKGSHTKRDIERIFAAQKGRCAGVGCHKRFSKRLRYEIDHIVPLSRGGTDYPRNLQLLCGPCNSKKHAKDASEHARSLGYLL